MIGSTLPVTLSEPELSYAVVRRLADVPALRVMAV